MSQFQSKEILSPEQKFQQKLFVVRMAVSQGTQAAVLRSGIPERTVRRWKAHFKSKGLEGLRERSRRPHSSPGRKDQDGILFHALVVLLESEPGLLRIQILAKLLSVDSPERATMSWLARTKKRAGLTRKKRQKTYAHTKRYEIPIPGYLQIDSKIVDRDGEPGEKLIQFTAIDECSRVRYLEGSLTKGAAAAAAFLTRCVEYYRSLGVRVLRVQTDHGTEFTLPENSVTQASYARGLTAEALFTRECDRLGIYHRLIRVRTPELNGKVERSHRTDGDRFYSRFRFKDEQALNHGLQNLWMPEYNEQRPHSSLGGVTPMDFLKNRLLEIESGKFNDYVPKPDTKKAA